MSSRLRILRSPKKIREGRCEATLPLAPEDTRPPQDVALHIISHWRGELSSVFF